MPDPITPDPGAGPKPWYDGKVTDAELIGHITTKGWDKKTADEVAVEAIAAHRAAEKMIGAPANELVRIPKADAPEAEVKAYWAKLGAGSEAKDYDLSTIKRAGDKDLDPALADAIKGAAVANLVPKDKVLGFAAAIVKHLDGVEAEATTVKTAALVAEKTKLDQNWGVNKEAKLFIAKQAAAKLGIAPEAIAALEGQIGYAAVMEMMRTIGTKIGEDRFVSNPGPGGGSNTVMSKEQAVSRLAELKADKAYVGRYMAGGAAEKREMEALNLLINS